MIDHEVYFPRGIATDGAFCNREDERKRLACNIRAGQHTLIMSPRRYGKTSLVRYVMKELNIPFGESDFFIAVDAKRIEQSIINGVKMVFNNINTSLEETLRAIRLYFKKHSSTWTIGTQGMSIALIPVSGSDPASNIMEALLALESLLAQKKTRAVLFLDEVQEIGEVAEGKGIEGAIRHVAQQSRYLSIIFSGSSRHLLGQMFFDKTRPLYKLCDKIILERISEADYIKHINKLARRRWGHSAITAVAVSTILSLTECHPYYVNNLCLRLWGSGLIKAPTAENVNECWHTFVKEEQLETARELSSLGIGQRKILIEIASGRRKGFTGKQALTTLNMGSSSVIEALKVLEQKDYIECRHQTYTIVDPLIKTALNLYFSPADEGSEPMD